MFKAIKNIFLTLFVFGLLIAIFVQPEEASTDNIYRDDGYVSADCSEFQSSEGQNVQTQRSWVDYNGFDYCMEYNTDLITSQESRDQRNAYNDDYSRTEEEFWGNLYSTIHEQGKDNLVTLLDSLWELKLVNNLDRYDFANTVVTFVQDIPYAYVLDEELCEDQEEDMNCVTGAKYGLLSPYEFLHSLSGDCDTRALLLYSIFKGFNYEPRIAISRAYKHAVLMLDVTTSGDYIEENGQKYFFWETTATGWQAGILPPDVSNVYNWKIVL